MNAPPTDLSTDVQPPLRVPLAHFLVGVAFLLVGGGFALSISVGTVPALGRIAATHLLLVGWVTLTILGAMTQFVPVWSGVRLHSRRLATLQLVLVGGGVAGLAAAFALARLDLVGAFALAMLAGIVAFCYNVGRTLLPARPWDVTEGHFALALAFFLSAATLGTTLALDFRYPLYPVGAVSRSAVLEAHVTVAVLGGVLATVLGALYQLGPMFTQSDATRLDDRLRRAETLVFPPGVLALAGGRLFGIEPVAALGGLGVAVGVAAAFLFLGRRLYAATVDYSPMLPRYAAGVVLGLAWAIAAGVSWLSDPLSASTRFGPDGVGPALLFGAIGFVVVGTLYHVVPFLIWVHRYSDRLGYEPVPMVDDLYDARLARFDLAATAVGTATVAVGSLASVPGSLLLGIGGGIAFVGVLAFAANVFVTVSRHAPEAADPRGWFSGA